MSRPNLKLAGEPPRSPEREALAEAIARHDAAVDRLAAVQAAREQATQAQYDAKDAIRAAATAVEQSKVDAALVLTGAAPGALSVKDARTKLQDCEDAIEAAISAGGTLVASEKEAAAEVEYANTALEKSVAAVVRAEAPVAKMLAEAKALQNDLVARRVELRQLYNADLVAEDVVAEMRKFLLFENTLPVGRGQVEYGNYDAHPAADPWKAVLQELRENADAPLPS